MDDSATRPRPYPWVFYRDAAPTVRHIGADKPYPVSYPGRWVRETPEPPEVTEFKHRWGEADAMGLPGYRTEYALQPLLDQIAELERRIGVLTRAASYGGMPGRPT